MISRMGKNNFVAAHYDWLALGVGLLALAGAAAFYVMALGEDTDEAAAQTAAEVARMKPSETGVKPLSMELMRQAVRLTRNPLQMAEVSEKAESFLASERRIFCKKCKAVLPGNTKVCPMKDKEGNVCGAAQEDEKKIVLDSDGDGMPDEWEKRHGLNPNDAADAAADADGDAFTNLEEYQAKTDPTNKNDHPDYLDSLALTLPLKETYLPFVFTKATKIPAGWRCEFFDAKQKDDYGRLGRTITAVIGEAIGESGYVLKAYEAKETKRDIKGSEGLKKTVDVSEATVERKRDKKTLKLVIAESKKAKPAAVDVQATLVYTRGSSQSFEVVPGSEINLSGAKYRIVEVKAEGKGAKVVLENSLSGKKRTVQALEQ